MFVRGFAGSEYLKFLCTYKPTVIPSRSFRDRKKKTFKKLIHRAEIRISLHIFSTLEMNFCICEFMFYVFFSRFRFISEKLKFFHLWERSFLCEDSFACKFTWFSLCLFRFFFQARNNIFIFAEKGQN